MRVLTEVRDGLRDAYISAKLPTDGVDEAIDTDFIQDRIRANAFDLTSVNLLVGSVCGVVTRISIPSRKSNLLDERVKVALELIQADEGEDITRRSKAIVRALRFMLDNTSVVRIDMSNIR